MSNAAELLTPAGDELLGRLAGLDVTPDLALRLATELRGQYPAGLVAAALTQQSLRVAAREKFSRAAEMYFTRAGLEQASAEQAAAHSAGRFAGLDLVADLCCGIGGDLIELASAARQVLAVDADLETLEFAMRNVAVRGASGRVTAVCADVRALSLAGVGGAFIDPARRASGRRLRTGDSEPPLNWCFSLIRQVPRVCVKAAPGLPHELVPGGWEVEFVAIGRALKEALLWSPTLATTQRRATLLPALDVDVAAAGGTLVASAAEPARVSEPGEYLLDPNPAVTRAGLVAELAREIGAWQIDPMIAFLSLDRPVSTVFARTLRILESMPWHEREVARKLRELGVGAADIRRRGLAGDVHHIRRRLALQGDRSATIVITRRNGRPWGLICEPLPTPASS
jgi:SAM-dependent methyltransferase